MTSKNDSNKNDNKTAKPNDDSTIKKNDSPKSPITPIQKEKDITKYKKR